MSERAIIFYEKILSLGTCCPPLVCCSAELYGSTDVVDDAGSNES